LWGYLKSRVYTNRPGDLEELKNRIRFEINQIDPGMLERSVDGVYTRLGQCQMVQGGQFEQFR
jgi:hypothetical protein